MKDNEGQSKSSRNNTLTVGLGASAGGLQPLKAFFKSLPENPGMVFIVVIHLSPDHESNLAEVLQNETCLEVQQVERRVALEENYVYVIPPNKLLQLEDGHLGISERKNDRSPASIDVLFRSLGEIKGRNSAGVIFSGTGSDGTMGIKTIKEQGGFTIVQNPEEAQYTAMPLSAINSGVADAVLSAEEIADALINYKKSLSEISIREEEEKEKKILQKIFTHVRSKTGHDFSNYKRSSVLRRIERRMQVNHLKNLADYLSYLQKDPDEIGHLFSDLLISVTNFFRDQEAFDTFENTVIPKLFENKAPDEQVRVWVPGCATGEEAYSIAMLMLEYAHTLEAPPAIQIFASDIDKSALNIARKGSYPESITADISGQRLERFFNHTGSRYELKESIRELILFAPHNLLSDPPFSKLDLITCRNLLIYLNRDLQTEVFNLFHYALRSNGYLFLGLSDSNLEASELFKPLDKTLRLYRRMPASRPHLRIPQSHLNLTDHTPKIPFNSRSLSHNRDNNRDNYQALHRNLLIRLFAPQSVIINDNGEVIHATEGINKFLEYPGGQPSHDILQMVKPPLRQALQRLLFSVKRNSEKHQPAKKRVQVGKEHKQIELIVHRITDNNFSKELTHVIFKEIEPVIERTAENEKTVADEEGNQTDQLIEGLQKELDDTKEQLQITVEEYETSNEELRASNEELQSMNEELQSTTEELETSSEELQSINEELKTVNRELESKVEKLNEANDDLKNLMEATEIGIIFVDREHRVQRFTSQATNIFNLIDTDMGRPIEHVTHHLDNVNIPDEINHIQDDSKQTKKIVSAGNCDCWYIMRSYPYRNTDSLMGGVVLTFTEITQLKEAEQNLVNKARQEEAVAQLGLYALDGRSLEDVVHRAIQIICEILEMDYCLLHEFDHLEDIFKLRDAAGTGFEGDCPADVELSNEAKWDVAYTYSQEKNLIISDFNEEKRFSRLPYLQNFEVTTGVNIPVEGTAEMYGVLSAYTIRPRTFSKHDISFLQVVANMIGEVIDRRQSTDELEAINQKLQEQIRMSKQYQREILNNSIAERWQLGGVLHDNLAQKLVAVKMLLSELDFSAPPPKISPLYIAY